MDGSLNQPPPGPLWHQGTALLQQSQVEMVSLVLVGHVPQVTAALCTRQRMENVFSCPPPLLRRLISAANSGAGRSRLLQPAVKAAGQSLPSAARTRANVLQLELKLRTLTSRRRARNVFVFEQLSKLKVALFQTPFRRQLGCHQRTSPVAPAPGA